jgi:hypothetical protein
MRFARARRWWPPAAFPAGNRSRWGERVSIGGRHRIVRMVEPLLGARDLATGSAACARFGLTRVCDRLEQPTRECGCACRERPASVCEHELGKLFGGVVVAGLKPMDRHTKTGRDLAQGAHARASVVAFEAADVCVADTLAGELALAEAKLRAPLPDPLADRARHRGRNLTAFTASPRQRENARRRLREQSALTYHRPMSRPAVSRARVHNRDRRKRPVSGVWACERCLAGGGWDRVDEQLLPRPVPRFATTPAVPTSISPVFQRLSSIWSRPPRRVPPLHGGAR